MKKIDGLHQHIGEMLILGGIHLIIWLAITPIDRHRSLNVINKDLIDIMAKEGHGDGTYRCDVSYNSHGEQLQ